MAVSAYQAHQRAFAVVFGVDFSGARLAGRTTWIARLDRTDVTESPGPEMALGSLRRLDRLAGTAERAPALAHLVGLVTQSRNALWAFDFPFGLPVELFPARSRWPRQLALVREYEADDYGLGLECLRRARDVGDRMHIRRQTDVDARAPFDPYHYRIIYQTFYGIHHVLEPLRLDLRTAVLPFHYDRVGTADRVLVEACPASTLKRLGLPHQNYKQPAGGPLTRRRRRTRRTIIDGITTHVRLDDRNRRVMMRDAVATRSTRCSPRSAPRRHSPPWITTPSLSIHGTRAKGTCTTDRRAHRNYDGSRPRLVGGRVATPAAGCPAPGAGG